MMDWNISICTERKMKALCASDECRFRPLQILSAASSNQISKSNQTRNQTSCQRFVEQNVTSGEYNECTFLMKYFHLGMNRGLYSSVWSNWGRKRLQNIQFCNFQIIDKGWGFGEISVNSGKKYLKTTKGVFKNYIWYTPILILVKHIFGFLAVQKLNRFYIVHSLFAL